MKTPRGSAGQNECSGHHKRILYERNTVETVKVMKKIREIYAHL